MLKRCILIKALCTLEIIVGYLPPLGDLSGNKDMERILCIAKSMDSRQTATLPYTTVIAVGVRFMVTVNFDKADGLINGALGTVMDITLLDEIPIVVWLLFDDNNIGSTARSTAKRKFPAQTLNGWTPVVRCVKPFRVRQSGSYTSSCTVKRKQFPLILAAAFTIHKTQGRSLDYLELDFKSNRSGVDGLHYVGLSRCRTESGNSIVDDIFVSKIKTSEKCKVEMARLRSNLLDFKLQFPVHGHNSFNVLFHNVQSLRKNIFVVRQSRMYTNCDVIILCETFLNDSDCSDEYSLDDFSMFRFDFPGTPNIRSHAGFIVYTRVEIQASVTSRALENIQYIHIILQTG